MIIGVCVSTNGITCRCLPVSCTIFSHCTAALCSRFGTLPSLHAIIQQATSTCFLAHAAQSLLGPEFKGQARFCASLTTSSSSSSKKMAFMRKMMAILAARKCTVVAHGCVESMAYLPLVDMC